MSNIQALGFVEVAMQWLHTLLLYWKRWNHVL